MSAVPLLLLVPTVVAVGAGLGVAPHTRWTATAAVVAAGAAGGGAGMTLVVGWMLAEGGTVAGRVDVAAFALLLTPALFGAAAAATMAPVAAAFAGPGPAWE